jgi:Mn2+/Fe2+ NRAMP family transporter
MKTIGYIAAAILVLFGVIFILGAFGASGEASMILVGIVLVVVAFAIIFFVQRKAKMEAPVNVTVKVDLPGDTKVEEMKCKSCGGVLSADDVKLVNGAPMVTCPYCSTVYQLTEEPKW